MGINKAAASIGTMMTMSHLVAALAMLAIAAAMPLTPQDMTTGLKQIEDKSKDIASDAQRLEEQLVADTEETEKKIATQTKVLEETKQVMEDNKKSAKVALLTKESEIAEKEAASKEKVAAIAAEGKKKAAAVAAKQE